MPLPSPNDKEKRSDFISRCVTDLSTKGEFEGNEQRVAVCISQFEKASKKAAQTAKDTFEKGVLGEDLPEIKIKLNNFVV